MTILVTGGAGYIGSHTVLELCDAGEKVVVVDDLSSGFYWAVDKRAELIMGDIGNKDLMASIIRRLKVDSIIHFAAKTVVPESVERPLYYYECNTAKTRSLLEVASSNNVKHFIFSSTAAVYGKTDQPLVNEDDAKDPISPYGMSKLMSEHMIRDVSRVTDMQHVILRYFNVAGADPQLRTGQSTANATHLIKVAVQAALGMRDKLQVYGTDFNTKDGTGVRDYIHVSDLAHAHICALNHLRRGGANVIANVGYGEGFSVQEVVDCVKNITGKRFLVEYAKARAGDAASVVAQNTIARQILQWTPKFNRLEDIVTHAYKWERALLKQVEAPSLVPEIAQDNDIFAKQNLKVMAY